MIPIMFIFRARPSQGRTATISPEVGAPCRSQIVRKILHFTDYTASHVPTFFVASASSRDRFKWSFCSARGSGGLASGSICATATQTLNQAAEGRKFDSILPKTHFKRHVHRYGYGWPHSTSARRDREDPRGTLEAALHSGPNSSGKATSPRSVWAT